tara:strand:+ start:1562 stop:1810 length:249 start_codon:yes stop_codon:yes gene_type:complete
LKGFVRRLVKGHFNVRYLATQEATVIKVIYDKMGEGLRQIEFGLFAVSSMKATQDVGLKFLSIRPYSEATVFVNQKSTSMHT